MPTVLAPIMPAKTGMLTLCRAISEAPLAQTSGTRATMKKMSYDRAEAQLRCDSGGLSDAHAALTLLLRKIDDQDTVLGRQGDQHSLGRGRSLDCRRWGVVESLLLALQPPMPGRDGR